MVMVAVSDLGGSGGAERLFSHLHEFLQASHGSADATLITASSSLAKLQAAGRLVPPTGVIALSLGAHPGRGRRGVAWMTLRLLWAILRRRFDVVHICLPSPIYMPLVAVLGRLPARLRPRLSLTVIDCTLAHSLESAPARGSYEAQVLEAHQMYVKWARLDAIYSWYRAFVDVASRRTAAAGASTVRAARFCFTEPGRFMPAQTKEPLIVFAGRLSEQKRPLLFVDAVAALRQRHPGLADGWRFEIYGKGVLEPQIAQRLAERGLAGVITLGHATDMAPVFARSRLFVSTQAFENFTSLAMLEAMAAGNAVIAEDVGQTAEFVRHGENGFLVASATADAFADAMAEYLRNPARHDQLARASRALATEVHTIDHFAADITAFWADAVRA